MEFGSSKSENKKWIKLECEYKSYMGNWRECGAKKMLTYKVYRCLHGGYIRFLNTIKTKWNVMFIRFIEFQAQ